VGKKFFLMPDLQDMRIGDALLDPGWRGTADLSSERVTKISQRPHRLVPDVCVTINNVARRLSQYHTVIQFHISSSAGQSSQGEIVPVITNLKT
jgi:hypothetical protein